MAKIGIIGGSGLEDPSILKNPESAELETPYGDPSSILTTGRIYNTTSTACGSLREEIDRGDLVILDQFIDFTRLRKVSFYESFEPGDMKHVPMADPFSETIRKNLIESAQELDLKFHPKGTVITIEGPRFSTRAESRMFRSWGADVINMSIAPEAILANELGIPYATIAMSTDYDCWHEDEEPVTWKEILEIFNENVHNVLDLMLKTLPKL